MKILIAPEIAQARALGGDIRPSRYHGINGIPFYSPACGIEVPHQRSVRQKSAGRSILYG
ncbi:hypothetical protein JXO59_15665 [candidate division KSB1 bacterium]|nr:hypothetical protein [candidate division KSB1 bacterium]